jgi:hypothetical protein
VITKNKRATSAQNYRINPEGSGQWLDGCWVGTPTRVAAGQAFAAHYVERSLLWLGRYLGTVRDAARSNRNSLVLDLVHCYRITDPVGGSAEHDAVKGILKQPGSVTYSYFRSEVARDEAVSETRFAEVQVTFKSPSGWWIKAYKPNRQDEGGVFRSPVVRSPYCSQ